MAKCDGKVSLQLHQVNSRGREEYHHIQASHVPEPKLYGETVEYLWLYFNALHLSNASQVTVTAITMTLLI